MFGPARTLSEDDDTASPSTWERALLDAQLETLKRLAEMGMAIAGAIQARVTAPDAPDTVVQHAAMDFARVSRAVRMTLALQSRLVRDFKTPVPSRAKAGEAKEPVRYQLAWIGEAERIEKRRVCTAVQRRAEDAALDSETIERLVREAGERLERDDIDDDLMVRPFDEIVAFICEELGLHHLPSRPPSAAAVDGGGGPLAERSEEPMVEGANPFHPPFDRFPERPPIWSG